MWRPSDRVKLNAVVFSPTMPMAAALLVGLIEDWDRRYRLWFKRLGPLVFLYIGAVYLAGSESLLARLAGPKDQRRLMSWRSFGAVYVLLALFNGSLAVVQSTYPRF